MRDIVILNTRQIINFLLRYSVTFFSNWPEGTDGPHAGFSFFPQNFESNPPPIGFLFKLIYLIHLRKTFLTPCQKEVHRSYLTEAILFYSTENSNKNICVLWLFNLFSYTWQHISRRQVA
jgi:hypothetical protein